MIKTEPAKYDLYPVDLGEVVIDLGMLSNGLNHLLTMPSGTPSGSFGPQVVRARQSKGRKGERPQQTTAGDQPLCISMVLEDRLSSIRPFKGHPLVMPNSLRH